MKDRLYQTMIEREQGRVEFEVIIHPSDAKKIVINIPGYRGDIDGFNNKYRAIGAHLSRERYAAFVQMPNIPRPVDYGPELLADLKAVCEYVLSHALEICGTAKPELCLAGISAGGAAAAAIANAIPAITKVLLIAPAFPAGSEEDPVYQAIVKGVGEYVGELYAVNGDRDDVVGADSAARYKKLAAHASKRESEVIPDCDHWFRGRVNGQVLSKAYLWAFAGDRTFPSPEGGLVLY